MAELNGKNGVWRTVGGRRIFIANGEDLKTAMKNSGKFKPNGIKDIVKESQPKDTKYMQFGCKVTKDEISLYAKGTKKVLDIDEDSDINVDDVAITKIENWAKKIGTQIKKDKSIKNNKEISESINDQLDSDWYSGMSFFGGDAPFTYNGFQLDIYLDE